MIRNTFALAAFLGIVAGQQFTTKELLSRIHDSVAETSRDDYDHSKFQRKLFYISHRTPSSEMNKTQTDHSQELCSDVMFDDLDLRTNSLKVTH